MNDGDGTFRDATTAAGLARSAGPALGSVAADFNGDGWPDLYVANDGQPNHLWISNGDPGPGAPPTFRDEGMLAGASVNAQGEPEASMGVDTADVDNDGDLDLFMTHLMRETNTLYLNDGTGLFADRTLASGLGAESIAFTSFGTAFFDVDNDGWLDLLIANGAVTKIPSLARQGDPFPLHQPNQLFRNLTGETGELRFREVTAKTDPPSGDAFAASEVSRGAVFGDVDNDGDADVLIVNNAGPVRLLLNRAGEERSWLGLRLVDAAAGRDLLGARAAILRDGGPILWRRAHTDGSYNASHDPRIVFGLGDDPAIDGVRVVWPDGLVETWPASAVEVGGYTTLVRGTGRRIEE